MTEIIGVRFKTGGKMYYFNPRGEQVQVGQSVIIETAKGVEFAQCVQGNTMVDEMELVSTLRPMLRVATEEDFRQLERNKEREKKAYQLCQKKIQEHKLDMKLVEVKYSFDGSKVVFYFTADERVDFRALVKDLASALHTRIELRQIGVRDEARMMGGLGICGRPFCCKAFLDDFQPVSIKMAKTQNISLNPTKISGACGRLMCCLKYEQDAYEDLIRKAPRLESLVKTPDGVGVVNQVNLLREQSRVVLDDDPETPKVYPNEELEIIRRGKGKRPAGYEKPEKPEKPERKRLSGVERPEQAAEEDKRRSSRGGQNRKSGGKTGAPKPAEGEEKRKEEKQGEGESVRKRNPRRRQRKNREEGSAQS